MIEIGTTGLGLGDLAQFVMVAFFGLGVLFYAGMKWMLR